MLSKARTITGVVAAAAGLLALATPAFAADVDHNSEYNGINAGNGNNVQVPIGVCNNNVALLGLVVPIGSPQTVGHCSTAVIDQSHKPSEESPTEESPTEEKPTEEKPTEEKPPSNGSQTPSSPSLPAAPVPTPVAAHSAVTG